MNEDDMSYLEASSGGSGTIWGGVGRESGTLTCWTHDIVIFISSAESALSRFGDGGSDDGGVGGFMNFNGSFKVNIKTMSYVDISTPKIKTFDEI